MLEAERPLDLNEIDYKELGVSIYYPTIKEFYESQLDKGEMLNDYMLLWLIEPPKMYASAQDDEFKKRAIKEAEKEFELRPERLKLVQIIKKEFYELMCTNSEYYESIRKKMGGNTNLVITGIAASIATKVSSLEIGVVTSFVTTFFIIIAKMGKAVLCEYLKQ